MAYLNGLVTTVLGDDGTATPTYDPGPIGKQAADTLAVMQATADSGDQYAKDWIAAQTNNEYTRATIAGEVPSYIVAPDDKAKFANLITQINSKGFTSLSGADQAAFNYLRSTGSSVDPGLSGLDPIGGKTTGVYAWDPETMKGDLPPGADKIAKDLVTAHSGDDTPYVPPKVERAITLRNNKYVYVDDGSAVPQSELDRLGFKVVVTSTGPAPTHSAAVDYSPSSATDTNAPPKKDLVAVDYRPADETNLGAAPPVNNKNILIIAGSVTAGVLLLAAIASGGGSQPRRRR